MKKILILLLLFGIKAIAQDLTPIARVADIGDSLLTYTSNVLIPLVDDSINAVETRFQNSITAITMKSLLSGKVYVGNSSNVATAVTLSGILGLTNTGETSIVDGTLVDADISSSTGIIATKIGNKDVDNTELSTLNGSSTNINTRFTNIETSVSNMAWIPIEFSYPIVGDYVGFFAGSNMTIDSLICSIADGSSVDLNLFHAAVYYENSSLASKLYTSDINLNTQHTVSRDLFTAPFSDNTIGYPEFVWIKCSGVTGEVSKVFITIFYTQNE